MFCAVYTESQLSSIRLSQYPHHPGHINSQSAVLSVKDVLELLAKTLYITENCPALVFDAFGQSFHFLSPACIVTVLHIFWLLHLSQDTAKNRE